MNDEEVAFRLVRLYFEEIARLGFKRQLDLDQIINSYFYALKKVHSKDTKMVYCEPVEKKVTTIVETKPVESKPVGTKETTTTTTISTEKPKEKSITDIIEGK